MDVLDVIGDPELRETLLAVRRRPRAASISEIADATGVHRNVARRRLERLVAAGLLSASFERPPVASSSFSYPCVAPWSSVTVRPSRSIATASRPRSRSTPCSSVPRQIELSSFPSHSPFESGGRA